MFRLALVLPALCALWPLVAPVVAAVSAPSLPIAYLRDDRAIDPAALRDSANALAADGAGSAAAAAALVPVDDLVALATQARTGSVRLVLASAHAAAYLRRIGVAVTPLLSESFSGRMAESGVIVVNAGDSRIRRLADLRGRMVALDAPHATQGTLLVMALLRREGLPIAHLPPDLADRVNAVFTEGPRDVLDLLEARRVDAGSLSARVLERLEPARRERLRVLATTAPGPGHVLAAVGSFAQAERTRIGRSLLRAARSGPGAAEPATVFAGLTMAPVRPEFDQTLAALAAEVTPGTVAHPQRRRMLLRARRLVIARISDSPAKHWERMAGVADYVARRLRPQGVLTSGVVIARDDVELVAMLRAGLVDWVQETALAAVILRDAAGAEIALLGWRGGVAEYHTVLVARRDSGITTLKGLQGKRIAFEDAVSTSAFAIPAAILVREGYRLAMLDAPRDIVPKGRVGYVFAGSELNAVAFVHRRLVDVAAVSNLDWEDPREVPPALRADLEIFYRSQPYPRALEILRGDLDPAVKAGVIQVLLAAPADAGAREALKAYRTTRFEPIDAHLRQSIERIAALVRHVPRPDRAPQAP